MSEKIHRVWLDCDPGHDDVTAILLALHTPNIELLGVSTVHGNADAEHTALNAARCLVAFNAPAHLRTCAGAAKPLLRNTLYAPEIHGTDGLGGVEGLPSPTAPDVLARVARETPALEAMAKAVREADGKVHLLASGPLTNIALFVSVYPSLMSKVEAIVFMGGGIGMGNKSPAAEFNILCDPEAAQIVLDAPVPSIMLPLNVTHQAIVTHAVQARLLDPSSLLEAPVALTPLRRMLSTLINFFEETYRDVFGFVDGPPLHDALTVAYVAHPELFKCKRYRVDVELSSPLTAGETVADIWGYKKCDESWGATGRNCLVAMELDADKFFDYLLQAVASCDTVSPLNRP
ncbi:nucleoside hydrolase [Peniophora sp. CONT]|nr:nucleoside hydrolase [Peniophora sp. CONT]